LSPTSLLALQNAQSVLSAEFYETRRKEICRALQPVDDSEDARTLSRQQRLLLLSHCSGKTRPPGVVFQDGSMSLGSQWLFAIPNPAFGQVMEPVEFRAALAFRLLMPIFPRAAPCLAKGCKRKEGLAPWVMDRFGYHALSCKCEGNLVIPRHEGVVLAVGELAREAGLVPVVNAPVTCLGVSSSGTHLYRPADVLLNGPNGLRRDCVDVTVTSSLTRARSATRAGQVPGALVATAAVAKIDKHRRSCLLAGKGFTPFAVDVCGMIDAAGAELLQRIASRQAKHSDRPYWDAISFCRRRVSFAIQHGVAKQLVAAMSSSAPSVVDGDAQCSLL
jgi:hypothetical protein